MQNGLQAASIFLQPISFPQALPTHVTMLEQEQEDSDKFEAELDKCAFKGAFTYSAHISSKANLDTRLPVELYESIMDYCTPATLYSCALICRSWLPRARMNLYTTPWLWEIERYPKFVNCLRISPSNGDFIRHLDLGYEASRVLVQLLLSRLLKNLKTLRLQMKMDTVHPTFFRALSQLKSLARIELLIGFVTFSQFARFLLSLPSLCQLRLGQFSCTDYTLTPHLVARLRSKSVRLQTFTLTSRPDASLFKWLLTTSSASTLRELSLNHPGQLKPDVEAVMAFVRACSSIQSLNLGIAGPENIEHISLTSNTQLRTLEIAFSIDLLMDRMSSFAQIFSSISSVHLFTIKIWCISDGSSGDIMNIFSTESSKASAWEAIGAALTRPELGCLQNFILCIDIPEDRQGILLQDRLMAVFPQILPQLHARGVLSLEYDQWGKL